MHFTLDIRNLSVAFGTTRALEDVTVQLEPGTFAALIGPNGSGKTTLLRTCVGLVDVKRGSASALGYNLPDERVSVLRRAGYVPDAPVFHDLLTAREIFDFCARFRGFSSQEASAKWRKLAPELDIAHVEKAASRDLSFGERKRTAFACALVHDPELLILDEVTTGLDPRGVEAIGSLLRRHRDRGCTVLLSTHLLDFAESADRIYWLEKGRFEAVGTPATLTGGAGDLHRLFLSR